MTTGATVDQELTAAEVVALYAGATDRGVRITHLTHEDIMVPDGEETALAARVGLRLPVRYRILGP
jgi:hypothetical protein